MSDHEETFETTDAGASTTYPLEAGQVRKGSFLVIKGNPCKVVDVSVSKTGKHGHAKCSIVGLDIFTGKKAELMSPSTHNVEIPVVKREQYILIAQEGDFATLMAPDGSTREDLKLFPQDPEKLALAEKLLEEEGEAQVDVVSAMGIELLMDVRKAPE